MTTTKYIITTVSLVGILAATTQLPIVPTDLIWLQSYETLQFNTSDGDLSLDEFAIASDDTWYIRDVPKQQGQFRQTNKTEDIAGKQQVTVRCHKCAYYDEFRTPEGHKVRLSSTRERYNDLRYKPYSPQPTKIDWRSLSFIPIAHAAISVDNTSSGTACANCSSISWAHTNTSGNLIAVVSQTVDSSSLDASRTEHTYNGDVFTGTNGIITLCQSPCTLPNGAAAAVYFLVSPDIGTSLTVSVTTNGSCTDLMANAITLNDVDTADPEDNEAGSNGGSGSPSVTINNGSDNSFIVDSMVDDNSVSTDITADYNSLQVTDVGADTVGSQYRAGGAAGDHTMSYTDVDSNVWVIAAISFEASTAGAAGPATIILRDGNLIIKDGGMIIRN